MMPPRSVRRFGLAQAAKWICLLFIIYMCILYVWKIDKLHRDPNEIERQFIMIPRPRRIETDKKFAHLLNNVSSTAITYNDTEQIAILVFCATRDEAIRNHLQQLVKQRPDPYKFPIYVSQDSDSIAVQNAITDIIEKEKHVYYMHHQRSSHRTESQRAAKNYYFISQHYKWALSEVFKNHSAVIITEDDLDIADDFFNYFASTRHLLDTDPTIFCVSAWNDNGGTAIVDGSRADLLHRTDFFPGLGWMLKADVGVKLLADWPDAYWDDWLRRPEIRQNRVCIRPEISRTSHNNQLAGKGSSNGMYKTYLANIRLPSNAVDFFLVDVSRLEKRTYDSTFRQQILDAKPITIKSLIEGTGMESEFSYRVTYRNPYDFRLIADKFKLMNDFRGGMTRTAYYGIVTFSTNRIRVYIVPEKLDLSKDFGTYSSSDVYELKWDLMNRYLDFKLTYCKPDRWAGKCDPKDPEMRAWFERKRMMKRLEAWGEMIVF